MYVGRNEFHLKFEASRNRLVGKSLVKKIFPCVKGRYTPRDLGDFLRSKESQLEKPTSPSGSSPSWCFSKQNTEYAAYQLPAHLLGHRR